MGKGKQYDVVEESAANPYDAVGIICLLGYLEKSYGLCGTSGGYGLWRPGLFHTSLDAGKFKMRG